MEAALQTLTSFFPKSYISPTNDGLPSSLQWFDKMFCKFSLITTVALAVSQVSGVAVWGEYDEQLYRII